MPSPTDLYWIALFSVNLYNWKKSPLYPTAQEEDKNFFFGKVVVLSGIKATIYASFPLISSVIIAASALDSNSKYFKNHFIPFSSFTKPSDLRRRGGGGQEERKEN